VDDSTVEEAGGVDEAEEVANEESVEEPGVDPAVGLEEDEIEVACDEVEMPSEVEAAEV